MALPFFLGIADNKLSYKTIKEYSERTFIFNITLEDNPLTDFVELPENMKELNYHGIICGSIEGALESLNWKVKCNVVKDRDPLIKTDEKSLELQVEMERVKIKDDD